MEKTRHIRVVPIPVLDEKPLCDKDRTCIVCGGYAADEHHRGADTWYTCGGCARDLHELDEEHGFCRPTDELIETLRSSVKYAKRRKWRAARTTINR